MSREETEIKTYEANGDLFVLLMDLREKCNIYPNANSLSYKVVEDYLKKFIKINYPGIDVAKIDPSSIASNIATGDNQKFNTDLSHHETIFSKSASCSSV